METATVNKPLTLADRCDRCGAQAYVEVTLASGALLFCGHHYTQNKMHFLSATIRDERMNINA